MPRRNGRWTKNAAWVTIAIAVLTLLIGLLLLLFLRSCAWFMHYAVLAVDGNSGDAEILDCGNFLGIRASFLSEGNSRECVGVLSRLGLRSDHSHLKECLRLLEWSSLRTDLSRGHGLSRII